MDVQIRINGTMLEDVTGDVKLNITSSSPYVFGESTRVYSATIKAPRNRTNDYVFGGMRLIGLLSRTERYEGTIYLGGFPLREDFNVKVSATPDEYELAFSQKSLKASDLPSNIITGADHFYDMPGVSDEDREGVYYADLARIIKDSFGATNNVTFPLVDPSNSEIVPVIRQTSRWISSHGALEGKKISFFFRFGADTEDGAQYFERNLVDIREFEVRDIISRTPTASGSSSMWVNFDSDGYVTLDMSRHGSILNRVWLKDNRRKYTFAVFDRIAGQNDINNVRYRCIAKTTTIEILGPTGSTGWTGAFFSPGLDDPTRLDVAPPSHLAPEQALVLTGTIAQPITFWLNLLQRDNIPFTTGKDLLDALCKALLWRWSFTMSNVAFGRKPAITVSPLLHEDVTGGIISSAEPFSEHRQDWSEFFVSLEKIEDSEGLSNNMVYSVGEHSSVVRASGVSFQNKGEAFSSALPLKKDAYTPRTLTMIPEEGNPQIEYFTSNDYIEKLATYYALFADCIDVTINAKIPYFRLIGEYKENGAVFLRQLDAWFYVRSITEFDVLTGGCKIKLTKINIKYHG